MKIGINTVRYKVTAVNWWPSLKERFGEKGSLHDLTYEDVVQLIIEFGKASIKTEYLIDRGLTYEGVNLIYPEICFER